MQYSRFLKVCPEFELFIVDAGSSLSNRTSAETARGGLELLGWADRAFYHAWRLAESLIIASGNQPVAA